MSSARSSSRDPAAGPREPAALIPGGVVPVTTLADVALRAGVSPSTASRVLNGSARHVQDAFSARVQEAAGELGYTPNLPAQAFATGTTTSIGWLVNDIDDPYFAALAGGMTTAADEHAHVVTISVTGRDSARELEIVRSLRARRSRAIVLGGSRTLNDPVQPALVAQLDAFTSAGGRVVVIGQEGLPYPTIELPGRRAAADLARELVRRGYRGVAILGGPEGLVAARERREGFLDGLGRHGLRPRHVVHGDFGRGGGRSAALELDLDGVDLVWAVNDAMAIGAMAGLRERGLRLPDDVAVAGFDDIATAVDVAPGLTTVHLPLEEAGRRAIECVFAPACAAEPMLEHALVIRGSTPMRSR